MNLRDLMDVRAICEAGSFRKAAASRGVTQPTLSNRIAHLEDQLGAVLFDRSRGQSRPTDLARYIAERTGDIAVESAQLAQEITRVARGEAGSVRIGFGPGPMRALAPAIVSAVGAEFPKLSLEILSAKTDRLGAWLLNREIDLAICPPIELEDPRLKTAAQLEVPAIVVARPEHPMFEGPPPTIEEVLKYPIALPPVEPRYLQAIQQQYGLDLDALPGRLTCSDYDLLVRLVADGARYFTAGPLFAFAPEIADGRLRVLETPLPFSHIVAIQVNQDTWPYPAVARVKALVGRLFSRLDQSDS